MNQQPEDKISVVQGAKMSRHVLNSSAVRRRQGRIRVQEPTFIRILIKVTSLMGLALFLWAILFLAIYGAVRLAERFGIC